MVAAIIGASTAPLPTNHLCKTDAMFKVAKGYFILR